MRVIVNENATGTVIRKLRQQGHDVRYSHAASPENKAIM